LRRYGVYKEGESRRGRRLVPNELRLGSRVRRVHAGHIRPELRGRVGTITQRCCGDESPAVFEVWFWDGRRELFLPYELEKTA
jgi:hypothetical protein